MITFCKLIRGCLLAGALLAPGAQSLFADTICQRYQGGKAAGCRGDDKCRRLPAYPFWECVPIGGGQAYQARAVEERSGFGAAQVGSGSRNCGMSKFKPLFEAAENVPSRNAPAKNWQLKISYYTQAIQAWQEGCDSKENKANAYSNRGFARAMLKEFEAAENDFNVAIKLNPGDPLPHNYLGNLYYTQEKFDQAALKFSRAFMFGLDDAYPDQSNMAHKLHTQALGFISQRKLAAERAQAERERLEKEKLVRERAAAIAAALANAQAQALNQAAGTAAAGRQQPMNTFPNPAVVGQNQPPPGADRVSERKLRVKEDQPPAAPPPSDWVRYCVIGLFLTTAAFMLVFYLVLKKDQHRIRQELGPLAKELGVDVKWMSFGLFIPPDTEYHGKLMVTLVVCSVLGMLGAGLVFFLSPHHETAIKILSGPVLSGAIVCLSVFGSYSLKTGAGGRPVSLPTQTGWTKAEAPADYKPTFTEGTILPDVPVSPAATGRTMRSSATRAKQIKMLIDSGSYKEALELFSRKSPLKITDADREQLFEIYLRLGDFDRAGAVFDSLKGSALLADNLPHFEALAGLAAKSGGRDLSRRICRGLFEAMKTSGSRLAAGAPAYYKLAMFSESAGDAELARDIFRHMVDSGFDKYKDTAARCEELRTRLIIAVAPTQRSPAASVPATGGGGGDGVIGTVLNGQYELKGELGEGGMAKVYEGLDRKTRKKVAVKKMHPWLKKFPEEHKRFVQEAKIVSRLTHPNIVGVQAIVEQEGEIYLIFDYVDGKTLADILKEKGLMQFQEAKKILRGICEAVRYAHKANVIHRDLKPSNIMITKEGQALVMDFGLASELRESLTRVTHQTTSGTPAYMAPEQYVGVVKRESDIYAMGVCLYELLTGKLPFTAGDIMQLKNDRNFRPATAELPWLPAGIDDIIARALAPEPSQRFADAMDLYDALDKL